MLNQYGNWLTIWSPDGRESKELHLNTAAKLAGVHRTTAKRWVQSNYIPAHFLALLQFRALGCLPGEDWAGWRVRGDMLLDTDSGESFRPYHMRAAYLAHDQVRELKRLNGQLRASLETMVRDRPPAPVLRLVASR